MPTPVPRARPRGLLHATGVSPLRITFGRAHRDRGNQLPMLRPGPVSRPFHHRFLGLFHQLFTCQSDVFSLPSSLTRRIYRLVVQRSELGIDCCPASSIVDIRSFALIQPGSNLLVSLTSNGMDSVGGQVY